MTNMSLRGKVTILILFFIVTFAAFFLGIKGHFVWAGVLLLLDFLLAFGVFELVTFLNKLAAELPIMVWNMLCMFLLQNRK